jgi:penicillin-binding protein 2
MPENPLFPWTEQGTGHHIERRNEAMSHEVLFEDDVTHVRERPLFLGKRLPPWRFVAALGAGGLLIAILLGRVFWMQVTQGASFQARAEANRLRHEVVPAKRGVIRDRNGVVLAQNTPAFDLQITPWLLPKEAQVEEQLFATIGKVLSRTPDELRAAVASSTDPFEPVVLERDLPYEQAIRLKIDARDPSVQVVMGNKRQYPLSAETQSLSHILGYVGGISAEELERMSSKGYRQIDTIGKTGIESTYEEILRGTQGERVYEVDARNQPTSLVDEREAVDGKDVQLSIDATLQAVAEKSLLQQMEKAKVHRGSVVAMDPRDGSIVVAVSLPAYNNNFFSGSVSSTYYQALLKNEDHPLLPRAWAGVFPSGSTIKPVIATAALAEGVITPQTTVVSTGGIHIGSVFFPDWKPGGHGVTNVRRAIAWSVNTFFYTIGGGYQNFIGLGVDKLTDWMRRFGLGSKTGLDVPGEASGFVPSREWKERTKGDRWYIGDTYNLSIGQGDLLVTPLQVARFTAMVANGGFPIRPHIGPAEISPATSTVAASSMISVVQAGMRDTVVYGSGRGLAAMPFPISGKTGTAQWRQDRANHAWFTSYAPSDHPELVVTVMLEEGVEGSATAVPVARDIWKAWGESHPSVTSHASP